MRDGPFEMTGRNNNNINVISMASVYITSCSRRFTILQKCIKIQINYNRNKNDGSNNESEE